MADSMPAVLLSYVDTQGVSNVTALHSTESLDLGASLDFSRVTALDLLHAAPTWEAQLLLILFHSVFWHTLVIWLLPPCIKMFINSMSRRDRYLDFYVASAKKDLAIDFSNHRQLLLDMVAGYNAVMVQHFVAGFLCLPALIGWLPRPVAVGLVCHGALSEVGWEIQDTLVRLKERLFDGEMGRMKNPAAVLVMYMAHHTAAQLLVLPLNMYYRENGFYHEAVFLLQGAVVVANLCQQFGFTRDANVRSERIQLKISVTFAFVTMIWTRVIRMGYLWYMLLATLQADGCLYLWRLTLVPVILFTLFNLLLTADCGRKFLKLVVRTPRECEGAASKCQLRETNAGEGSPTLLGRPGERGEEASKGHYHETKASDRMALSSGSLKEKAC